MTVLSAHLVVVKPYEARSNQAGLEMGVKESTERHVVGGVDTHKELHVAAVVDEQDRPLATASFATTRQGYRQMLAWMRSFGTLKRVGIESTGSYGAGLLRFMQKAGIEVLEALQRETIVAGVASTTISMLKARRTPPSPARAPSRLGPGTG